MAGLLGRALCAVDDWLDWFQEAHPTAAVAALTALALLAYGVVGALE